jgi:hypothetical protein
MLIATRNEVRNFDGPEKWINWYHQNKIFTLCALRSSKLTRWIQSKKETLLIANRQGIRNRAQRSAKLKLDTADRNQKKTMLAST